MQFKKVLITGGAGFVGSSLAILFREHFVDIDVIAFDNLMRRGSELNLSLLQKYGVQFVHGDVRNRDDFDSVGEFDLLIDCSAEPSVHAGRGGSPRKVVDINLGGTLNCLEAAKEHDAAVLFLSSSRVYPIKAIRTLDYIETETRFELSVNDAVAGVSERGISEAFSLIGPRSFYGVTKLSSEYLLQEYVYNFGMRGIINRCGLLAGPRQMGRVDQGVVSLWVARHLFKKELKYIGFGGSGKQVRDMLHVNDLFRLICTQISRENEWDGSVFNVGGGNGISSSLLELTEICRDVTGNEIAISSEPETSVVDIPVYISDCAKVNSLYGWSPEITVAEIIADISCWLSRNHQSLKAYF